MSTITITIGTKINRWTVIGEPVSRNGRKHYPCRCDCSHEQLVRSDNLKSGHSIGHRGCPLQNTPIKKEVKVEKQWKYKTENNTENVFLKSNLLGNFYGPYYIASIARRTPWGDIYFNCIDDNGKISQHRTQDLHKRFGLEENNPYFKKWTQPGIEEYDGILKEYDGSNGEQIVKQWLENHNIKFEREYVFEDLYGQSNHLRFDFKINNKPIVIEFQGKQHFEPVAIFGGQEKFELQRRYDNIKRAYCKEHNIKLIEIPYNYKNIEDYLSQLNS